VKIGVVLAILTSIAIVSLMIWIPFMNQAHLIAANFAWVDNRPVSGLPYVHLDGEVVNIGSSGARNAQLVTKIFDSYDNLLITNTTDLGNIPAGTHKQLDLNITYAGKADKCDVWLKWNLFGG